MKILISGAGGFLGAALTTHLGSQGHTIFHLVRRTERSSSEIYWDPYHKSANLKSLEGFEAVIHLSGENVASSLWTSAKKFRIYNSRIKTTRFLVKCLGKLQNKPSLFICASGIGFYPDGGDQWIDETTTSGYGFFPTLCYKWEAEATKAQNYGIHTLSLRTGMVLSRTGGALPKMCLPLKWGLGAILGSGDPYMSWIHLEDYLRLVVFCLLKKPSGAINATAPGAVSLEDLTRNLAKKMHRPVFFRIPELLVRLLMGEMGIELFLKSMRVRSVRLEEMGFSFTYPDVNSALEKEFPG